MNEPDLSALDGVDPEIVERLGPWWRRVYQALLALREEDRDS